MKYLFTLCIIIFCFGWAIAQPNCAVYEGDKACHKACKKSWKAIRYAQGSYTSQKYFDESIELCPDFAYAHQQKAVAFLKRGQFIEWKEMIDKAVELAPKDFLGYRGWCRVQFLKDYAGGIQDIEELKEITNGDIGYCQNGDYHLDAALALFYKEIGQLDKANSIYEQIIENNKDQIGLYDYYHIGILALEMDNPQKAIDCFEAQQKQHGRLAETLYYKAMAYKALGRWSYMLRILESRRICTKLVSIEPMAMLNL